MDYKFDKNLSSLTAQFRVLSSQILIAQTAEAGVTLANNLGQTGVALEDAADISWSHVYRIASDVKDLRPNGCIEEILASIAEMIFELMSKDSTHRLHVAKRARALRMTVDCQLSPEIEAALDHAFEFAIEQTGLPNEPLNDGLCSDCLAMKM